MLKQTLSYAVSVALMRGISLIMLPIVARFLSPSQMGEVEILSTIAILGSIMVGGGLEDALFRFAGTADRKRSREIAASIYFFALILGFIFLGLTISNAEGLARLIPGETSVYCVQLVAAILCLESLISVPLGYLRMTGHCYKFCFANIMRVILHASFTMIFLSSGSGIEGVFEASLIAAGCQALLLSYWQIRSSGMAFRKGLIKPIFIYSLPIIGSGFLAFGLNGVDRWALAEYMDMDGVALYAIALKFSIALTMLMQPFNMWWMPKRFSVLSKPNGRALSARFSTIGLLLIAYITLLIGVTAPSLINLTMPDFYRATIPLFFALLFIMSIKEIVEIINVGCFAGEKTYVQLVINTVTMTSGAIGVVIGAMTYGIWGVIAARFVAHGMRCLAFYYYSQQHTYIVYPKFHLVCLYVSIMAIILISHMEFISPGAWQTIFPILIALLIMALLVAVNASIQVLRQCGFLFNLKFRFKQRALS